MEQHPLEIELKLTFPPEARAQIEAHPALAPPPKTERLLSTYYDTPDHTLARCGYTLRVRRSGGRRLQTVKADSPGGDGAASRRGEWEWPLAHDAPDLGLVATTPLGPLLGPDQADRLAPVLTTDIRRTTRRLHLPEGAVVEAALDEGRLRTPAADLPVHELELELKERPVGPLYRLALALQSDLPLRLGADSKAARGYRLLTGAAPEAVKAGDMDLPSDVTAADGFRRILGAGLGMLLANQPAAASGVTEGVHQMRIAIRRLRTALTLFSPHLEPHATARFTDELRRLGRVLGAARDWDVFCLETLPAALEGAEAERWCGPLREAAQTEREAAHRALAAEFAGPALTGLALALAAWTEDDPDLLGDAALQGRLAGLAPALLDRLAHKAHKRGRHIARLAGPELHALRKSLKKLRYAVDDLAGLYGHKGVKAYRKQCKALQQFLGEINDARVAVESAEHLSRGDHVDLVPGVAAIARWAERQDHHARDRLAAAWQEFADAGPFW